MEAIKCINCEAEVNDKFCSHCGQRVGVKRITFREGWNDFWARIYGFDGMFPRTLRDLTVRPGLVAQTFINGNRVRYYGPVGYFFFIITLMYLVASLLGIDMMDFFRDIGQNVNKATLQETPKTGSGQEKLMNEIMRFTSENMKLLSFTIVPIQALCSRFLFFRKSGLNFVEHMVLPLYTQGHVYWISILSFVTFFAVGSFLPAVASGLLSIFYFAYSYPSLFTYQSKLKAFFKGLGIYFLSQFLFLIAVIVIFVIVLLLNPDFLEMIRPSNNR